MQIDRGGVAVLTSALNSLYTFIRKTYAHPPIHIDDTYTTFLSLEVFPFPRDGTTTELLHIRVYLTSSSSSAFAVYIQARGVGGDSLSSSQVLVFFHELRTTPRRFRSHFSDANSLCLLISRASLWEGNAIRPRCIPSVVIINRRVSVCQRIYCCLLLYTMREVL